MSASLILSWTLPIVIVAYMATLARLVCLIRKENTEYWMSIGNPSLWEPNGQAAILKRIFFPKLFPNEIADKYKNKINVVRALGLGGLIIFAAVLLLIGSGWFEPA